MKSAFVKGDSVEKTSGDYRFKGTVVSVFYKISGVVRYVVENDDGLLFIFSESQLTKCDPWRENVKDKTCPACGGDGEQVSSHRYTCYDCNGTGKVTQEEYDRILKTEAEASRHMADYIRSYEYRKMGG